MSFKDFVIKRYYLTTRAGQDLTYLLIDHRAFTTGRTPTWASLRGFLEDVGRLDLEAATRYIYLDYVDYLDQLEQLQRRGVDRPEFWLDYFIFSENALFQ